MCKRMGMTRSLTMAYHPQANGWTEVLNQSLEISLHTYINLSRNDWASYLDAVELSYNTTPHMATRFASAYLPKEYILTTGSTLVHCPERITRPANRTDSHNLRNHDYTNIVRLHSAACNQAQENVILQ